MTALRTVVEFDDALPLVHLSAVASEGSLLDPEGKEGTTRLLLRLMRRSVLGIGPEELDESFDRLGGTLGADINRSVAGFHGGAISRSTSEFLELTRRVLSDPEFSEEELERLRGEALADFQESLDNDSLLARRAFARYLFLGHPYSRLAGGDPSSLKRIQIEDLKELYGRLFRKNSLKFALAGDITRDAVESWVESVDQGLEESAFQPSDLEDPEMLPGRRLVFIDKPERTQTQILIGGLGTHPGDQDHTALYLGHMIFGGTFSARLSREVRGKRGWSYGASSSLPFDRKRQAFTMWTFPQSSDAANCIRLQLELLEKLIDQGVTPTEVKSAKKYLENSHVFSIDTASKRASMALDEDLYGLPSGYFEDHVERVRSCSVDEVNAALKNRLSTKNLLICLVGTAESLLPEVQSAIGELGETIVEQFNSQQ